MESTLTESLASLPSSPGVYEMKNEDNETLYVGKAKTLKNRVRSYFQNSSNHSLRIQKLVEKVHHVEWTETRTEVEALILENNLIKEKYPKFNILLRDDKTYAYIKITNEDFPRIQLVRKVLKDGAKYFGPKTSSSAVRKTIEMLQDLFHFRSTAIEIEEKEDGSVEVQSGNQKIPCLNYHLKKCDAPCIGKISKEAYAEKIVHATSFLKGNVQDIIALQTEKMMNYARDGKFELAAKMRDSIKSIENISQKQIISAPDEFSADIIGIFSNFGHVFFHVFSLREGKIINSETFPVMIKNESSLHPVSAESMKEALQSFLRGHSTRVSDIPKTIIVDAEYIDEEEKETWEEFFFSHWQQKTEVCLPQRGKRKELLFLAHQNAESYAKRHSVSFLKNTETEEEILEELQEKLKMKNIPARIECYDISHFSGEKTVASMVVLEDGKEKNSDYRSFNIKSLEHRDIDDFKSLAEALSRRLMHLPEKFPSEWNIQKLKRKKDFALLSLHAYNDQQNKYLSEVAVVKNKIEKKQEMQVWGFLESKEVKMGNKPAKKMEVFHEDYWFFYSTDEEKNANIYICGEGEDIQKWRFILSTFFEKARQKHYSVFSENKEIEDFLFSLGFEEDEKMPHAYTKKWISQKKNSFAKKPDLLVIDGGKGQLSSTWDVLKDSPYADNITICSLAKREEEVFSIDENGEIYKTEIEKNSPCGHMLQRIRDEAHRFAITKNRSGREKIAQKSVLDEIPGIGGKTKKVLKQSFGSIAGIRNATDEELLQFVNQKVLKKIREKI